MNLINQINKLKKEDIAKTISERMREFEELGKKKKDAVFGELCFCLLTANFSAERCISIQKEMGRDFSLLSEKEMANQLKKHGHRFPNARANYIYKARSCENDLLNMIGEGKERREKLVKNIKGLGMKEASHFLRNIGFKDIAIIDFHIVDLLKREGLIEFDRSKETLNKKKYLEIEKILEDLGKKVCLNLAELDLYLWYIETGKVLK
ncbi:MAG: N-glycosylase/DNA lyase [Candidatus Pacearchaeota archaeon]